MFLQMFFLRSMVNWEFFLHKDFEAKIQEIDAN